MNRKEHLTEDGLRKIVAIKGSINLGLTDSLLAAFPNLEFVPRPQVEAQKVKDSN